MGASSSVQGGGGHAEEDEYRRSYGRRYGNRPEVPPAEEGEEGDQRQGERAEVGDESRDTDRRIMVSERGGAMARGRGGRGLFDLGDLDPSEHSPSIQELHKHMSAMRSAQRDKFARGVLLFANTVSLVFACVLIYYGCAHSTDIDLAKPAEALQAVGGEFWDLGEVAVEEATDYLQHGYIRNILRPYQLVLALGVSLMFLSLVGFLGTACPSRRIGKEMLFGYFSTVLVFVCVLMWGAVMCFQYQNETQRFLEREVDANWRTLRPLVDTNKKGAMAFVGDNSNLVISGAMCVVSAVVLTVGLWASSKTMGHYFTVKKVLVSCSLAGVCSSVVLVSLSIFYGAKGIGGAWAPGTTAVSGVAILLLSLLGMYGVRSESLLALTLHLFLLCILSLVVAILGVFIVAYPHVVSELVHRNWRMIRNRFADETERQFRNEVADNLLLLGSAAILFSVLLILSAAASFACCLETYRKRKSAFLGKLALVDVSGPAKV